MSQSVGNLIRQMRDGQITVTTSDAIIAEAIYILSGPPYLATRADIATHMLAVLEQPSFVASQKHVWRSSFEIWLEHRGLSFVDAMSAAYSLHGNHELATFDKRLSRHPGLKVYRPSLQ